MFKKPALLGKKVVMSYKPVECPECKGGGFVVIRNAYDPDYAERDYCSYCLGVGYLASKEDLN